MSTPTPFVFSLEQSAIKGIADASSAGLEYSKDFQFAQLEPMDGSERTFSDMVAAAAPNASTASPIQGVQNAAADEKAVQVPPPANVETLDPQERASRALSLPTATTNAVMGTGGDTILNGIQKLRGVFDTQVGQLNQAMNGPMDNVERMMSVQKEMLEFSVLVEVSSKLVGKSTQALETLMKGQ